MKLITPPKPIPPRHNAAAIATLPTEHTNAINAMNGPMITFSIAVRKPWPWRKRSFQTCTGTSALSMPAIP